MTDIDEKKKKRFQFLHKLYELSDGNERKIFSKYKIGEELDFEKDETIEIYQYLKG